jgi:glutathione-specific gamma-glutamylcyclotransferase
VTSDRWIFGYGSLIWRPAFVYVEQRRAVAHGWARRFWQKSTDHRGTPDAPGRVVTLVPVPGARCVGAAFRVATADADAVIAELDVREQQGYEPMELDVFLDDAVAVRARTYVAAPDNPYFAGAESTDEIAAIVRVAHGPSGANLEYARRLAAALAELDGSDPHVDEILSFVGSS